MITRRRLLTITAAALATPARATPIRWHSRAMGAEVSLTLDAPRDQANHAIAEVQTILTRMESLFSLYDPASALSRLNTTGQIDTPDPDMLHLLHRVTDAHSLTQGHFDPTVQPLWHALANGLSTQAARRLIGWHRVTISPEKITLDTGQSLTLNGIAQGFATDRVADCLRARGFTRVLVNIGEFNALGGPWRIGIEDPTRGLVATRRLTDRAIATSSPAAMRIGTQTHILNPKGPSTPLWSTVSVEAQNATQADALSTGFCTMTRAQIETALRDTAAKATLLSPDGHILTL